MDETEAAELADEIELLASEYDIDATEVVIRSDTEYLDEISRGLKELRTSDSGNVNEFFAFDAGDASAVRATVLRAVGDDDFDAVTSERAFRFSQDVQDLSSNSNVEGVDKVINQDLTAKDGAVNANDNNVKGAMYELRVAEGKLVKQLDSSETLKLSYEPDVDFDELSDSDISEIAKETDLGESDIKEYTGYRETNKDPEFDGFVIESDRKAVYYEAKSGKVTRDDIEKKVTFLKGYERLDSDVTDSQLRLNSLEPRSNTDKVTQSAWDYLDNNEFGNAEQFDWSGNS